MVPVLILAAFLAATPDSGGLPRGQVIASVVCDGDATETYALYLPSGYDSSRTWPVIYGFDPGGRGLNPVERYRAAAEKYGYIVAGSNNSRNGSWAVTQAAVSAMTRDVASRFNIDEKREYVAGMSGGSRVALGIGLSSSTVAGVMASSAGYPDNQRRKELPFPVFETAGTEDFNYLEMRGMDRDLKTPHRLAVFEGGHMWLSSELAVGAVEWMEIQAMKSGRKPSDKAEIDAIYASRVARVAPDRSDAETLAALKGLVDDFTGLEDVSQFAVRAKALASDKRVRKELESESDRENTERATTQVILGEAALLTDPERREGALKQLRQRWAALSEAAKGPTDTQERRMARRVLSGLSMDVTTRDPEYLAIIGEYRMARPGR